MGSFDYTCCVSGLPIHGGDDVRYFLLTKNPYGTINACYMHDIWFPRNFPLKAQYNYYGSVEKIESKSSQDLWMDVLKIDLKERGWGDNSFHDVPTSKDMSFDQFLNAVQKGRVKVSSYIDRQNYSSKNNIPIGVPTRKRIEKIIKNNKLENHYLVSTQVYGCIRIRWNGLASDFGKDIEKLEKLQLLLVDYSSMITAGIGAYAHTAELLVHPKPGTNYHGGRREKNNSLLVQHAMIREDVWQALLQMDVEVGDNKVAQIKSFYKWTNKFWKSCVDQLAKASSDPVSNCLAQDSIPLTVGLSTNWKTMVERFAKGDISNKEIQPWLNNVAEFIFIHSVLQPLRYWWRPSYSCGPQTGEHFQYYRLFTSLAEISANKFQEEAAITRRN